MLIMKKRILVKRHWTPRLFLARWIYVTFLVALVTSIFMLNILYNTEKVYLQSSVPGYDNVGWIFTQFTWWTTMLFTIIESTKLIYMGINRLTFETDNRFIQLLFSQKFNVIVVSSITIVGELFWIGRLEVAISDKGKLAEWDKGLPKDLLFLDNAISYFVHGVNPIVAFSFYIYLSAAGYSNNNYKFFDLLKIGLIYPSIYMTFYVVFAWYFYDPYPISNLREGHNVWMIPVGWSYFILTFWLLDSFPKWIAKRRLRRSNRKSKRKSKKDLQIN